MGARVVTLPRRAETPATNLSHLRELEADAELLWDQGDVDAAIERWSDIVRQDPGRSIVRRLLAKAQMVVGKWEEASRQLNLCLTLAPGSAGVTAELGVCYLHLDQRPNALLLLRESLRLEPGKRLATAAMEVFAEEAAGESEEARGQGLLRYQGPPVAAAELPDWDVWIDRALESETATEAGECLFDLLLIAPTCSRALYELARLEDLTGRLGWARRYYERAMECDPQAWQPHFNLARLYVADGDCESARPLLERAALLSPGAFAPCWLLAQVCELLEESGEAMFWLRRAKVLDRTNADVEVALARLCGDEDQRLGHLETAVQLGCDRVEVLFDLGICQWRAGRMEAAVSNWRRCGIPEAVHACAAMAFEAGAHVECGELLDVAPHAGLLALLGQTWAARGETDRAIECYRAAVSADKERVEYWVNLGSLLAAKGLPCAEEWQTAVRLDPALAASYFR